MGENILYSNVQNKITKIRQNKIRNNNLITNYLPYFEMFF